MATSLTDCYKRGCTSLYSVVFEGIPYVFVERKALRVDANSPPSTTSGYTSVVGGLSIDKNDNIGSEVSRKTGIGRGEKLNIRLFFQPMEDAGILSSIFAIPTKYGQLTADVDHSDTTIRIDTDDGWAGTGTAYLGLETFTYSSFGAPDYTFGGVTRAVVGNKHLHRKDSHTNYCYVTDKPVLWRGRMVTVYESVVNAEGRILDQRWLTGDYTRQVFKGFVSENPQMHGSCVEITATPMVRRLASEIGYTSVFDVDCDFTYPDYNFSVQDRFTGPRMYQPEEQYITWIIQYTHSSSGAGQETAQVHWTDDVSSSDVTGIFGVPEQWGDAYAANIAAALNSVSGVTFKTSGYANMNTQHDVNDQDFCFDFTAATNYTIDRVWALNEGGTALWFIRPGKVSSLDSLVTRIGLPCRNSFKSKEAYPWLVLKNPTGEGSQDAEVQASGVGIIEAGGKTEVVEWSEIDSSIDVGDNEFSVPSRLAVHVTGRALDGGEPAELVDQEDTIKFKTAAGGAGTLAEVFLQLFHSSGTGQRDSTYDTLGFGFGYGIDSSHIDQSSITSLSHANDGISCINEGMASLESLIGGWFVACLRSLVNYRNSSGVVQVKAVDFMVNNVNAREPGVVTLTSADVLLDKIQPVAQVDFPNQVRVKTATSFLELPDVIVRDIPRIQTEGVVSWEITAPGLHPLHAIDGLKQLIAAAEGYGVITLNVGPWIDLQPGDPVVLSLDSHPVLYDWSAGSPGATSVSGRVLSASKNLASGKQTLKICVAGNVQAPKLLAPASRVTAAAGDTLTIAAADTSWYAATEYITVYSRGDETAFIEELLISSIDTATGVITCSSTPSFASAELSAGNRVYITYPQYDGSGAPVASAAQREFMYEKSTHKWGA